MLAAQHGPRLVWLGLLSICLRSGATDVQWQISIAWEDENCDAVCASNGLACTEACWPNTARGLENALRSSGLHSTCFGVEAGSPNPWHPAKDPENTMCYWFGGHTASDAPRCPLTPATPAAMLENSRVIRRLCPCISGNSTYGWLDCGLDGEPMDPAPTALGWIDDRAATTTSQPTPIIIPPGEQQPAPAPPQVMPGVPACQELCVAGFAGEDEFLNGRYVRLNGESGRLAFWSKFGGLPDLSDGRLQRGGDGVWRYYSVSSRANTSIGEGTLKTAESDIPQDDYVLTPTGGYQVEYQCCPQTSQSPTILGGQEDTRSPAVQDTLMRPIMAALIGGAALLCVLPAIVYFVYRWRPRVLRKRAYQEFQSEQSKGSATVSRDPEKDLTGKMSRLAEQAHAKQAMMPAAAGRGAKASVPTSAPSADGLLLPNTLLPNPKKGSASAVADVLGKSSTMSQEGIYEGPTRQCWKDSSGPGRPANAGLGGSGFRRGAKVQLKGLQSSTWNGSEGTVEGFDEQQGALEIRMPDGRIKLVRPENCIEPRESGMSPAELRMQLNVAQMASASSPAPAAVGGASQPIGPRTTSYRKQGSGQTSSPARPGIDRSGSSPSGQFGDTSHLHKPTVTLGRRAVARGDPMDPPMAPALNTSSSAAFPDSTGRSGTPSGSWQSQPPPPVRLPATRVVRR